MTEKQRAALTKERTETITQSPTIRGQGNACGTGGKLILGNIHDAYEYTLSAWDTNNNQINVNTVIPSRPHH